MIRTTSSKLMLLASAAFVSALGTMPAMAQGTPPAATEEDPNSAPVDQDEIVVTGTSIRGVAPVGSTLINIDRSSIEASTATTTDQIIKEIPQIFNYGVTESSRTQEGGGANVVLGNGINIRGIAPYATLTIINGRRAMPQGTFGSTVDPSNIPAIALERIEIIADGASAVYGSDAVTGVANLILRRRYEGLGVDAQYGFGDDYHTFTANAIYGKSWDTGRFTVAAQHAYRTTLNGFDRSYARMDLRSFGGRDYTVTQCNPGNIVIGANSYPIPATGATPTNLIAGNPNRCDTFLRYDLLPRQEINSVVGTFDQDLSESVRIYADAIWSRRDGYRRGQGAVSNLVVPQTNAYFVQPAGTVLPLCAASAGVPAGTRCETVQLSFDGIYGPNSVANIRAEMWQATGGFEAKLSKDWTIGGYATYGWQHDQQHRVGDTVNVDNLALALASSNRATAFNPFGTTVNNQSVVNSIFDLLIDTSGKAHMWDFGAKIDGPLFELPGGQARIAIGGAYNYYTTLQGQIRGPAGAQTGVLLNKDRKVKSAYAELFLPLIGGDSAMPGIYSLDIDVAGRIDQYSEVGTTKNPKIGVNWRPFADLKLHGSFGTSFRAPLLPQQFSSTGESLIVNSYFDPRANGGAGGTIRGVVVTGDNAGLEPETARTWSFGLDYTPAAIPGAHLSLNYFSLFYDGQIALQSTNQNILRQEALYGPIIYRGAAATALITADLARGLPFRNGTLSEVQASPVYIDGRAANLGVTSTTGIDFLLSVPFNIEPLGAFRFSVNGTRFLKYKFATSSTAAPIDQLNNINFPLTFRARGGLSWKQGPFDTNVFVNYTNAYNNTLSTPTATRIAANATVDLSIGFDAGSLFGLAREARLGLDVTNLFDKDPPYADIASNNNGPGGFDATVASPVGRLIAVSFRSKF